MHTFQQRPATPNRFQEALLNDEAHVPQSDEAGDGVFLPDFGLDQSVTAFGDYMQAHLHPRSCVQLAEVVSGVDPFESFNDGSVLMQNPGRVCSEL